MKIVCPNCHETLSLAALIEHDAAREAVRLALDFPAPLGKPLLQYVSLFKPAQRALGMGKFAAILNDLLPMVRDAKINHTGNIYAAPQSYWIDAINQMVANKASLSLPLKTHGYLLKIIAGLANKVEAKQEKQHEQSRKYGEIKTVNEGAAKLAVAAAKRKTSIPANVQATLNKLTGKQSKVNTKDTHGN